MRVTRERLDGNAERKRERENGTIFKLTFAAVNLETINEASEINHFFVLFEITSEYFPQQSTAQISI